MSHATPDLVCVESAKDIPGASELVVLSPYKVLLLRKPTEKLNVFKSILRWCGVQELTEATDLRGAIHHLVSHSFDLIFVTYVGKEKETSQFIEELKSLDATSNIPLIAITTDGEIKNMLRILAMGVDEVIATPLTKEKVENAAIKILKTRLGIDPIKARLDSAKELTAAEQFDAAKTIYLELIDQGEALLDAHLGLCEIQCSAQQWSEAETHLKKALELGKSSPGKMESHIRLASVFFHYGNYNQKRDMIEKAIKCYQTALSLNPFHTESVKVLLGLLQQRDEEEAIAKIISEVSANFLPYSRATDEIALYLSEMARRLLDLNMTSEGRRIYEQLIGFPHGNVDVHLKVANFFLEEGMVSQVLERLVNLLQKLKDSDILFKTGSILLDIEKRYLSNGKNKAETAGVDLSFFEDLDSAKALSLGEKMFKQGLLLEPESLRFSLSLARCQLRQGEKEAAEEILDRLKEMCAEDAGSVEEVVDALIIEGAYEPATEWINYAVDSFPQEIVFYTLHARLFREQKRPYDAISCLKRALTIESSHTECIMSLAGLYEEIKEYSNAILYYEKAIKLMPKDQTIREKLNRILKLKYKK
jgi:tetratricopeptide (TPR) repeat protein